MLCDWLPPDFGAVGQYALAHARDLAGQGNHVALVGFSATQASEVDESIGEGTLRVRRLHRRIYDRTKWLRRAFWTVGANVRLLWGARRELRRADEVQFTGSPPYLLHFVMPLALLLRRRTRYRITDFHPECLMAAMQHVPWWLRAIGQVTWFWRRRVDVIEVLGEDQRTRLAPGGVDPSRVELRRDPSPVEFGPNVHAAAIPEGLRGQRVILYSGNWGVAHDHRTFVEGFALFCAAHPRRAGLWLNATGGRADLVAAELAARSLPHVRTLPVPLAALPSVLLAADVHLITLDDPFVGYVLPSKVYACIASGRPVLFVGPESSDVHSLCAASLGPARYRRVDVGDAPALCAALESLLALQPAGHGK